MRFQLTMIARHFQDGLRALRSEAADTAAAERAYTVGSRQLNRVPWERAWAGRLKELFQLQQQLRCEIDRVKASSEPGLAAREVEPAPASRREA